MGDNYSVFNEKKTCGNYLALKIISVIIYVATTAFLLIELFSIAAKPDQASRAVSLVFYIAILLTIFGSAGYLVSTVLSLIGLILTAVRCEKGQKKGQLIFFIITAILPVLTEVILFIVCSNFPK